MSEERIKKNDKNVPAKSDTIGVIRDSWKKPKILSTEPLEAAAATCDSGGGFGKSVPTCNPTMLGS